MTDLISAHLMSSSDREKLDEHVKNVLAMRPFLSRILKETVKEVEDYSPDEVERMIGEDIQIGGVPMDPGLTNSSKIRGDNTEDNVPFEGITRYDILTHINVPDTESSDSCGKIRILINVEAQNDSSTGTDHVPRGIYYGARLISSQKGVEFTKSNYQNIKKVYSIWICFNCNRRERNTITRYGISKDTLYGSMPDRERYDLMSVIFVRLGGKISEYRSKNVLRMLMTLFSNIPFEEKRRELQEDYGIALDKEGSEVEKMCNFSEGVYMQGVQEGRTLGVKEGHTLGVKEGRALGVKEGRALGVEEGIDQGHVKDVDSLMTKAGYSLEKACELLDFPVEVYMAYKESEKETESEATFE